MVFCYCLVPTKMNFPDLSSNGCKVKIRRDYGAKVLGFDLSKNMVDIAQERLQNHGLDKVNFEIKDATQIDFPEGTFDVIYSR